MTQYERRHLIGEGRQGLVFRAYDRVRGRTVALKTLRVPDPESLFRLKREFRALASVSHPNLVALYDLVVEEETCFFTMELVDGVDLVTDARRASPVRWERVRQGARQLALAIGALHAAGTLHRDVKPSNVLVEPAGRVVVLDFGFVAQLARPPRDPEDGSAGTLAYMAPEQVWGGPASPASDWYGVGATLYEALTGRVPFAARGVATLVGGEGAALPPPRALVPDVPPDLEALVVDLLQRDPARRPALAEILERLAAATASVQELPAAATSAVARFVGRAGELDALRAAWRKAAAGSGVTVDVSGASGIGKTALVERFLSTIEEEEEAVLTLRGRCHPQESIPFKAVDGVVDDLTALLRRETGAAVADLPPPEVVALARVFPVLERVPAVAAAVATEAVEGDLHEVRRRAIAALRALLARLAERASVAIWIDDLQWGDLDSVAILHELRREPAPPRVLLILSYRAEDRAASETLRAWCAPAEEGEALGPIAEIPLGPLAPGEVRELARSVLGDAGVGVPEGSLEAIASESGGSPFFAGELARHLATGIGALPEWRAGLGVAEVVERRIAGLSAASRRVLNLVAVAGRPIDEALAVAAAGVADAHAIIHRLRHQSLLRAVSAGGEAAVAVYHDRIREAVTRLLPAVARQALHRELAQALEARPAPDPLLLVDHYLQAGDRARAADLAYSSAERAARALAFLQAASLYRRALELGSTACPRWRLHARLAEALVNAGFGGEAAEAYLVAAEERAALEPRDPEVIRLRRCGAEQYLRSGYVDEGVAALRDVLRAVGLRYFETTQGALLSLVLNRARLRVARAFRRAPGSMAGDPLARERLEACWAAGLGVSVFDSIRGAEFQVRHALLSRGADDPSHRARSLATEAVIFAMEGGRRKRARSVAMQGAGQELARASGDPRAEAHALLMSAGVAFFDHRYREAVALCDRGEALCRARCVGAAWELANMQFLAAYALGYLGELALLRARLPAMLRHARERGDQFALTNYRVGMIVLAWLAPDTPDEARRQVEAGVLGRMPRRSAWQHYMATYAHVHVDLYAGAPRQAWERLAETRASLRRAQMLRLQSVRLETRLLRARAAIAMALGDAALPPGMTPARLLRVAARAARQIAAEDARWAPALADSLAGAVAAARADVPAARVLLGRAAVGFEALDLGLHAAAARLRLAGLLAGGEGAALAAAQEAWMRARDIAAPARMAAVLVPGAPA